MRHHLIPCMIPGASGFSPSDVDGLVAWLRTEDISGFSEGQTITGNWSDQSGNGNDAVASGTPVYRDASNFYHDQPMIEISNSSTDRLTVAADATLDATTGTYFCVFDLIDLVGMPITSFVVAKQATTAVTIGIRINNGKLEAAIRRDGTEGTQEYAVDLGGLEQGPCVLMWRYDGTNLEMWCNNYKVGTNALAGSIDPDNGGNLVYGNHPTSNASSANSYLGDLLVYDNARHGTNAHQCGRATASSLAGPWTKDSASPILLRSENGYDNRNQTGYCLHPAPGDESSLYASGQNPANTYAIARYSK